MLKSALVGATSLSPTTAFPSSKIGKIVAGKRQGSTFIKIRLQRFFPEWVRSGHRRQRRRVSRRRHDVGPPPVRRQQRCKDVGIPVSSGEKS